MQEKIKVLILQFEPTLGDKDKNLKLVAKLLKENIANSENFHFAHIEKIDELTKKISFNHVMNEEHHIEYIEAISNDGKYLKRKFLKYDEKPEMVLKCDCKEGFYIRLYCNKDGVWITK